MLLRCYWVQMLVIASYNLEHMRDMDILSICSKFWINYMIHSPDFIWSSP